MWGMLLLRQNKNVEKTRTIAKSALNKKIHFNSLLMFFWIENKIQLIYSPPAILNIGRYIDITSPPIITPKNTNIKGSISSVRLPTAWSTSSS